LRSRKPLLAATLVSVLLKLIGSSGAGKTTLELAQPPRLSG
jgi:hypothetical protein